MPIDAVNPAKQDDQQGFLQPSQECDVVMKGGVTSGIVYPPVILRLAKRYRLRCIGGTSAGAIAAAVTAAAEYGREQGGFEALETTNNELTQPGFLLHLFQATPRLQPLMELLLQLLTDPLSTDQQASVPDANKSKTPFANLMLISGWLLTNFQLSFVGLRWSLLLSMLLILLSLVVFEIIALFTQVSLQFWSFLTPLLIVTALLVFLGCWVGNLYEIFSKDLPRNFFGMCSGYRDIQSQRSRHQRNTREPEVLTDWLSKKIDRIAGLPGNQRPLTFGDLHRKEIADGETVIRSSDHKTIELKMVTTNLSHNQPYTLPFENHLFLFHEDEFSRLFPAYVVAHLKTYAYKSLQVQLPPNSKYHFLPTSEDLPVIVATRMSLSFPLLLSAIPLYTIAANAFAAKQDHQPLQLDVSTQLQRNWFSDGGICSNFPLHFFDSWLPGRPTFGINLTSVAAEAVQTNPGQQAKTVKLDYRSVQSEPDRMDSSLVLHAPEQDIYLPKANALSSPDWIDLDQNLPKFLYQVLTTAQNYRETLQSRLPGYQERIVQIRLTKDEGGLNLGMSESVITKMMERGARAGDLLLNEFDFSQHQWVRLELLLGLLEEKLEEIETQVLAPGKLDYKVLLDEQEMKKYPYHYPDNTAYIMKAKLCIEQMRTSAREVWQAPPSLSEKLPRRKPGLQITPRF